MFSAIKIVIAFVVACTSVFACISESTHPMLLGCAGGAFVIGIVAAEAFRAYRKVTVRSSVN